MGLWQREPVAELDPAFHNLQGADMEATFNVGSYAIGRETMVLSNLYASLKKTYCGSIGADYMHLTSTEEKRWLQDRLESIEGKGNYTLEEKTRFLESLTAAEGLEKYLGAKFPGAKRFSLEGGDAMVPMLKELIRRAGEQGCKEAVIGMAHRGRLNVLINVLGKRAQDLFDEFAGKHGESWGTGDVKYHMGFSSDFATPGGNVHLALAFNPSHLEESSTPRSSAPCVPVWTVAVTRTAPASCPSPSTVTPLSRGRGSLPRPSTCPRPEPMAWAARCASSSTTR